MAVLRFEHRHQPLASRLVFAIRFAWHAAVALSIIGVGLALGMAGYHWTERMDWLDAFVNAAMLLGGMGPVDPLHTEAGKIFAGCYALFCGLVLVLVSGIILAPIVHRILHAVHIEPKGSDG